MLPTIGHLDGYRLCMDVEVLEPEPVAGTDARFDRLYPAMVELARRLLDPDGRTDASIATACSIAQDVLLRARVHRVRDDAAGASKVAGWTIDECLDRMVGHPGDVELRAEVRALLAPTDATDSADPTGRSPRSDDSAGHSVSGGDSAPTGGSGSTSSGDGVPATLRLSDLQASLSAMRRTDRRVGLVVLAGGFSPAEAAALLGTGVRDVGVRLGRVGRQLADRRRLLPIGDLPHPAAEPAL